MKLLYVGDFWEFGTCLHRMRALERLGFQVEGFDTGPYASKGGRLASWLRVRLLAGRTVDALNVDLLARAASARADFIWLDKPTFVRPETLIRLKRLGGTLVGFVIDNPFSPLPGEPGWRLVRQGLPHFDLNLVPRPSSIAEYRAAGAGAVALMPLAFEPWRDFPPSEPVARASRDVAFIGAIYGDRPAFVAALAGRGIRVFANGAGWSELHRLAGPFLTLGPPAFGDAYRLAIWDSRICLGLVTHGHREPWAHRAFEITAAGGFLLAERTDGHRECFAEGSEAEFFGSVEEAADKARHYLANPEARAAIARAGCRRAWTSGYSNDERLAAAFATIDPELATRLAATAAATIARRRADLGID